MVHFRCYLLYSALNITHVQGSHNNSRPCRYPHEGELVNLLQCGCSCWGCLGTYNNTVACTQEMIKDLSTSEGVSVVNKTVGDAISAQIGAPIYGIYQVYCFHHLLMILLYMHILPCECLQIGKPACAYETTHTHMT
jgi:hypothetical protein